MSALYRAYCWLGRTAYWIALPVMRLLPFPPRVRVIVVNEKNQVLLVKNWFGSQAWSLPGGGVGRHESFEQAAVREVFEETGIQIDETRLKFVGFYSKADIQAPFAAHCLQAFVAKQNPHISRIRRLEILDVEWVDIITITALDFGLQKVLQDVSVES